MACTDSRVAIVSPSFLVVIGAVLGTWRVVIVGGRECTDLLDRSLVKNSTKSGPPTTGVRDGLAREAPPPSRQAERGENGEHEQQQHAGDRAPAGEQAHHHHAPGDQAGPQVHDEHGPPV